ncbi:hypothetical protein EKD04_009090 [Chloroflexales bacterium ZM16-3]|nr:hypothetical protein [Chloroflexales bacterium ZM16-3]
MPDSRARYPIRGFALFLIALILLSLFPGQPTFALDNLPSTLDNSQSEFATGVFQRTAISPDKTTFSLGLNERIPDEKGLVQLAPAGILQPWSLTTPPLNLPVSDAGVTALGTRIYVVGGLKREGGVDSYSSNVYWSDVNPTLGSIVGWQTSAILPTKMILDNDTIFDTDPNFNTCKAQTTGARTKAGVVGLPTGTNTGYIYVVGGRVSLPAVNCGVDDLSTSVVLRGTVASNGSISWDEMAPVPSPPAVSDTGGTSTRLLGVDGAATVIGHEIIFDSVQGKNIDHTYLYVIGGESLYLRGESGAQLFDPKEHLERTLKTVFYTEINGSGDFINPDTKLATNVWKRDVKDIDFVDRPTTPAPGITAGEEGIWEATASATNVTVGSTTKSAIFLSGGAWDNKRIYLNSNIYRAMIRTNGVLDWEQPGNQTVGAENVVMGRRTGTASIIYNNKLYMIGGRTTNLDTSGTVSVPTAFLDDNLDLIDIDGSFIIGDTESPAVLKSGSRYSSGVALVQAQVDASNETPNAAWVFVIGGSVSGGTPTATIYRGAVGGDEALNTNRTPDGWYYSNVFQSGYNNLGDEVSADKTKARLLAIHWAAEIDRPATNLNADIEIQFRTKSTLTGLCADDTFSNNDAWIGGADGVDGDGNPSNSLYSRPAANDALYNNVKLADLNLGDSKITGHCLQYRVHLVQGGSDSSITPKLLSVYIEREIATTPDISIPAGGFAVTTTSANRISNVNMTVQNLNLLNPANTLSVENWLTASNLPARGSFFVNLCIARTDLAADPPILTLPSPDKNFTSIPGNTTTCPYYAEIFSSEMGVGKSVNLASNTLPFTGSPRWYKNLDGEPVTDIMSAFSQYGHYQIGLVLDATADIAEGDDGEANNRSNVISFTVEDTPVIPNPDTNHDVFLPLVTR